MYSKMNTSILSISLLLFFIVINVKLSNGSDCFTDCTFQKPSDKDISVKGWYCVTPERPKGRPSTNGKWKEIIPCTPKKPIIRPNVVMPDVFRYNSKRREGLCNGRCGPWMKMTFDWCLSDDYSQYPICNRNDIAYHSNYWPRLVDKIKAAVSSYRGYNEQSSNPVALNIEDIYLHSKGEHEEVLTSIINSEFNPIKIINSVFTPGDVGVDPTILTVSMRALIKLDHFRNNYNASLSQLVLLRYKSLQPTDNDEAELLLPIELGGNLDMRNIFPLKKFLQNEADGKYKYNKELSFLREAERSFIAFLLNSEYDSYVEWTAIVYYENIRNNRPKSFLFSIKLKDKNGNDSRFHMAPFNNRHYFEFIISNEDDTYIHLEMNPY